MSLKSSLFLLAILVARPGITSADDAGPASTPAPLPPELQALFEEAASRQVPEPHITAKDPLASAWELARLITGDHDAACLHQHRCVQAYIKAGRLEEAARLTLDIPDYRSAVGSLECADALLLKGKKALALEQIERVERVLGVVKPWQQDVIRGRMAATGALAGWDDAQIAKWTGPIEQDEDRFGIEALVLVRRMTQAHAFDLARLQELLKNKPQQKTPIPELVEAARWLLKYNVTTAQTVKRTPSALREDLVAGVDELLRQSHAYPARALMDLATFWFKQGDKMRSSATLARAEPQLGFHLENGGSLYYEMAGLWPLRGTVNDVRPFYEKLEVKAHALLPMDRPAAYAWMAACWNALGDEVKAAKLFEAASREAAMNPNPRMSLIGGIEVCLCHAEITRPLSDDLVRMLTAILKGEGAAQMTSRQNMR